MTTDDEVTGAVIRISVEALAKVERLALDAAPHELGGIMVGWWEGDSTAVVGDLLHVPDHSSGRSHYERRHSPAQEVLDDYRRTQDDQRRGYIGEWHSHPAPQPPSSTDRGALSAIVRQSRKPVALVVLALTREGAVDVHGLIGHPRWPRRTVIAPAVVERMSS